MISSSSYISEPEGNAIVYCDGAFMTTNGKTAHGLVRFTKRYRVLSVVDSTCVGKDAGEILDGKPKHIPIYESVEAALNASRLQGTPATHLVVGLAPDGGRISAKGREDVLKAIQLGLHIDSGLHDFFSDDPEFIDAATRADVAIRDIRKPPSRETLHFFTGKIEEVRALKIAVLGTDSAVGKRTTAWMLVHALNAAGYPAEMVGTGQTSWLQGAAYSFILDTMINDFLTGEIEHAVWSAWDASRPAAIIIEGQGSLLNPAYPSGYEILAAARPDLVILQHAPARKEYDGFPGYRLHPLWKQVQGIEVVSGKPVVAVSINHENIPTEKIPYVCDAIEMVVGLPTVDVLVSGADKLVETLIPHLEKRKRIL
ncbi:MAG: DUF1611 domain-containing protein [Candidatus Omnitrophota bacterium]